MKNFFFSKLFIKTRGQAKEFKVESHRNLKSFHIFKLRGIDSISEASKLIGSEVLSKAENFLPLKKGEFFTHQIKGLSVETKEGEKLGHIKDVMPTLENEILVMESKGKEVLIPFVQKICLEIDFERKRIVIDPPIGLLDLNEI